MGAAWVQRLALQAFIALLLGGCAGGGGGGGPAVTVPPPPPPVSPPVFPPLAPPHAMGDFPSVSGSEYTANWGVAGTNAVIAWQNGATGAGVIVGVIDDGIHPSHPELTGRISPDSVDIVAGRNALVTDQSHGSELASLIAGNYNNSQTVGVAFDATILAVRADDGTGTFASADLAAAIDYARTHGVDVINLSLGSSTPSPQVFRDAMQRATQAGIIVVVSAGNSGGSGATEPNYPGFLATDPFVSNGLILVAGGLNQDGTVNPASNPPGSAANWYLTAPGWSILVPDYGPAGPVPGFQVCGLGPGGTLCRIQGTSYASPHVAGAIALLIDAFPGLTPSQVVNLLLTTTDDTGAPGIDGVNGRGRLNIGRAFQPVGPLAIPLGGSLVSADSPLGVSGEPFGDGLTGSRAWLVVGFDSFGRTFPVQLANSWLVSTSGFGAQAQAPSLWRTENMTHGARMQMARPELAPPESLRLGADRGEEALPATRIQAAIGPNLTASFAAHGARTHYSTAENVGHLGYVPAETSLEVTRHLGEFAALSLLGEFGEAPNGLGHLPTLRSALAARASFAFNRSGLDVTFGQLTETNGLMGLAWSSTLGVTPNGETHFAGVEWRFALSRDWRVSAAGEYGVADFDGAGWLSVEEPLRTTAFSLALEHDVAQGWLGLTRGAGALRASLSQPLRVEEGVLSFSAPTANEYGLSSLGFETRSFEPEPSGRELRAALAYRYFVAGALSAFGEATYVHEPGHVSGADAETAVRVGLSVAR